MLSLLQNANGKSRSYGASVIQLGDVHKFLHLLGCHGLSTSAANGDRVGSYESKGRNGWLYIDVCSDRWLCEVPTVIIFQILQYGQIYCIV